MATRRRSQGYHGSSRGRRVGRVEAHDELHLTEDGELVQAVGRSAADAPEIDGRVLVRPHASLRVGEFARVRITRAHLEEDVGKNFHFDRHSGVDFNRAGVPLIESVTEADIQTAEEAHDYHHMTAAQAATLAKDAQARALVLSHLSQRYTRLDGFVAEAGAIFPGAVAAQDFTRVAVPPRLMTVAEPPPEAQPLSSDTPSAE